MSTFVDELKREHRLRYRYILATDIQKIRNRVLSITGWMPNRPRNPYSYPNLLYIKGPEMSPFRPIPHTKEVSLSHNHRKSL